MAQEVSNRISQCLVSGITDLTSNCGTDNRFTFNSLKIVETRAGDNYVRCASIIKMNYIINFKCNKYT